MSNVNSDVYVLRLANTSNGDDTTNPLLSLDANNNEYTIQIPSRIVNKGKCFIKVISGIMGLEYNGTNRIVPDNAIAVFWRSNIPYLGFDIEDRGSANAILASAVCNQASTEADEVVSIDATEAKVFTCPRLPERISIKKFYTSSDTANDGLLTPAQSYTTNVVPCEIVLEVIFDEDASVKTSRELNALRN
jgi:hypothetical protein